MKQAVKFWLALSLLIIMGVGVVVGFVWSAVVWVMGG